MRSTVHHGVPAVVSDALLGWLPQSEHPVSVRDVASASVEVAEGGTPVGVALIVEGRPTLSGVDVTATCAGEGRAAEALAAALAPRASGVAQIEVSGPMDLARSVAVAVADQAGGDLEVVMQQRLMVSGAVVTPAADGQGRHYRPEDRRIVARWLDDFAVEALGATGRGVDHWLERLEDPAWQLWLWEVDGIPVSLVNGRSTTPVSSRIGPVYTPPEQRGNGYAAGLTAHVTAALLDEGAERVTLFTDEANPTSTQLYARVGYVDVGAFGTWLVTVGGDGSED